MAAHKYKVGQTLMFSAPRMGAKEGARACKVVRQLPAQNDGQLQYRIKCTTEAAERIVTESALYVR